MDGRLLAQTNTYEFLQSVFNHQDAHTVAQAYIEALIGEVGKEIFLALCRGVWGAEELCIKVSAIIILALGASNVILSVEEAALIKKGRCSARVRRQLIGTAVRIENCQVEGIPEQPFR